MSFVRGLGGWVWLALAVLIIGLLTIASATSPGSGRPLGIGNAKSGGGLALYLWLHRLGYDVESGSSLLSRGSSAAGSTLLILDPPRDLTPDEISALRRWVGGGGRAVLATDGGAAETFGAFGMPLALAFSSSVSVTQPLLLHPPAASIDGSAEYVGRHAPIPGTMASTSAGPVLVRKHLGHGVLWLLAAPDVLDNGHLVRADNRKLALNLFGAPGSVVRFAELTPAGSAGGGGATDWLTGTVWGAALWFLLLVVILYRWLSGWRLGPPVIPFRERRRPAVEFVISLSDLLRRARKRAEVLAIYQRGLRRAITRRVGTDDPSALPEPLRRDVEALLQTPASMTEDDLLRRVDRILESEEEVRNAHV